MFDTLSFDPSVQLALVLDLSDAANIADAIREVPGLGWFHDVLTQQLDDPELRRTEPTRTP